MTNAKPALEVYVDGERLFVAALDGRGALGCTLLMDGIMPTLVCNTDRPLWWPRVPLRLGSDVSIRRVEVPTGDVPMDAASAGFQSEDGVRADELAAAEPALPPPTTFRGLRVSGAGADVVAGVRRGVVILTVSLWRTRGRVEASIGLTGLDTVHRLHHRWWRAALRLGDRVTAKIIESDRVDTPLVSRSARDV